MRPLNKKWNFLFVLVLGLVPKVASAAEIFDFYTGVRQLGMGGAYTAVVNDETALLTNPAGLGKIRDITYTLADPELHGAFLNNEVAPVDRQASGLTIQGLLDLLNQAKGKHWHFKGQAFPSVVAPNFGFGVHAKYLYDAEVVGTNYRLDYTNDYAAALGYCFRFFGGIVKLGVTGRLMNRVEIHTDLSAASTNLEVRTLASEGMGMAADVGLILTAPVALLPALAIVLRDAGDTYYDLGPGMFYSTATRPNYTRSRMDVGLGIFPIIGNHTRMSITADVHDVMTLSEETDQMRRVHAGLEFNFSDFFFLRAGANQAYWTAGMELATERFQLQMASYGEEIGTASAKREDRRWISKFSLRY